MKIIVKLIVVAAIMLLASVAAFAQQKPLKGTWSFTIQTPTGPIPTSFTFKKGGKGSFFATSGMVPLGYRERNGTFSMSAELPNDDPTLAKTTVMIRGTKTTDSTLVGDLILFLPDADASSPFTYKTMVIPGGVTGQRQ